MKRRMFVGLAVVCAVVLGLALPLGVQAQEKDVTGTWQGTLAVPGHPLRLVVKISKDDSVLKATIYSIDQKAQFAASKVTRDGATVKVVMAAIGGSYEGKLSADGNTLDGAWTQGSAIPLKLEHVTEAAAWTIPEPAKKQEPMAKDADPGFEVATIKPAKPGEQGKGFTFRGERMIVVNFSLNDLICFAYGVNAKQISGVPAWAEADNYDIEGKPDVPGAPNVEQVRGMLKKLIAERFQVKFHLEKKSLSVYALEPGKGAPKLTKADPNNTSFPSLYFQGLGKFVVANATFADVCKVLQQAVLDRPVVDQTGLPGKWDFTLNWTADESQFGGMGIKVPPPTDKADAPPPLFTAIQEQLGLKLEATKALVDVMVVDKAEKPSDN